RLRIGVVSPVSENSSPEKGPAPPEVQSEPGVVGNDRCVGSGGGWVLVVVVLVVVVVVVVGTVTARESASANWSIRNSIGPSWVGVPHVLRAPLNEPAAFWAHASSTAAPLCAALDQHLATDCAF